MNYEAPGVGGYFDQANIWYHVVVTRNASGTLVNFYKNGVLVQSSTYAVLAAAGPNNASIGMNGYSGAASWYGKLDDLRIYNRTLSAAEIAAIYTSTR